MNEYSQPNKSSGSPHSNRKVSIIFPEERFRPLSQTNEVIDMEGCEPASNKYGSQELEERGSKKCRCCNYKCRRKLHATVSYFREYCDHTSLHGLQYMGEVKRPMIERICWVIAFGLSIAACSSVILKLWRKWENTPVIVSFADSSTPVWQIPFPAITICPEVKYRRKYFDFTKIRRMLRKGMNVSEEDRKKNEYRTLLCEDETYPGDDYLNDTKAINFFQEAAPPCDDLMYCIWKGDSMPCCMYLFRPIMTEDGVCYTFNTLATAQIFTNNMTIDGFNESNGMRFSSLNIPWSDWNAQDGYPKSSSLYAYPNRGPGSGATSGLTVYLKSNPDDHDITCRTIGGFKVLLHNPSEFPRLSQLFFRAPLSQDVVVSIKPNIMGTSKDLRDYPSSRRRCLFQHERQLQFFTYYTQRNCDLECVLNATLHACHCMPFFMPRYDFPICGTGKQRCVQNVTEQILNAEVLEAMKLATDKNKHSKGCNCLPACTELNYDAETSMGTLDVDKIYEAFNVTESEYLENKLLRLSFFFKEGQFITSRRGELYGQTDFLANCGGLLGLFMGFSILSLVEILYFFTLRLFHNLRGLRNKNKSLLKSNSERSKVQ